jgi:hypothetical protein
MVLATLGARRRAGSWYGVGVPGWGCVRWRESGECDRLVYRGPSAKAEGGYELSKKKVNVLRHTWARMRLLCFYNPPLGPAFGHLQNGFFGVVKLSFPAYFLPWKGIHAQDKHIDFKKSGEGWSGREDLNLRPPEPHSGALPVCATSRQRNTISSGYSPVNFSGLFCHEDVQIPSQQHLLMSGFHSL